MFCEKCGAPNESINNFCGQCGVALKAEEPLTTLREDWILERLEAEVWLAEIIGDVEYVVECCDKILKSAPNRGFAYYFRGEAYKNAGYHNRAIEDLSRAIKLGFGPSNAYCFRGEAYFAKGELEQAMMDLNKAIELDSSNGTAYDVRGFIHLQEQKPEDAFKDFNFAVSLNNCKAEFYAHRGLMYEYFSRWKEAAADYRRSLSLGLEDPVFEQAIKNNLRQITENLSHHKSHHKKPVGVLRGRRMW